jgi:hypothetical protein
LRESELESEASTSESEELAEQHASETSSVSTSVSTSDADITKSATESAAVDVPDDVDELGKESEARFREIERSNVISEGLASAAEMKAKKSTGEYKPASVVLSRPSSQVGGTQFLLGDDEVSSSLLETASTAERKRRSERAKAANLLVAWARKNHDELNPYEKFSTTVEPRFRAVGSSRPTSRSSAARRVSFPGSGVWISGKKCGNVTWWSDSRVTCVVPAGVGGHLSVRLLSPTDNGLAAEIVNNETTFVSYELPEVVAINQDFGFQGTVINANVSNLGPINSKVVAFVGKRECARTTRISESVSFICFCCFSLFGTCSLFLVW